MEKELHGKAAKTDEEKCHILGMQSNSKNKTIQAENRIWNTTGEREREKDNKNVLYRFGVIGDK